MNFRPTRDLFSPFSLPSLGSGEKWRLFLRSLQLSKWAERPPQRAIFSMKSVCLDFGRKERWKRLSTIYCIANHGCWIFVGFVDKFHIWTLFFITTIYKISTGIKRKTCHAFYFYLRCSGSRGGFRQ